MTEPRLRAADADRDAVLNTLQEAHAVGRLNLGELSERQDQVIAARYLDELAPIVADLPEGAALNLRSGAAGTSLARPSSSAPAVTGDGDPTINDVAIMSGKDVRPAPGLEKINTFQWWGGDNIDLSDALGPGRTVRFDCVAVMAGSDLIIPEGVRVIDKTVNVMAGNDVDAEAQGDGSNGTLILSGFSWWAGHHVRLSPEAKRQRKARELDR